MSSGFNRRAFVTGAAVAFADMARADAANVALDDDTETLQQALDRGGTVRLRGARRYRVSAPAGARAALLIRSGTVLDLGGAVLELAPGQYCSLIATAQQEQTHDIRIAGGEIIGNGSRQPPRFDPGIGIAATLQLSQCTGLELRDLRMRDTYMYSVFAQGDDGTVDNVSVTGAVGGGIHLTGARWRIDKVDVRNVTFFDPQNCTGNPFIVSLRDSTVGSIRCENYGYGVKFQDGCENVSIDSIVAIGGPNNTQDYLVKIQGMKDRRGTALNRHIRVGSIIARNGPASGLYIIYSDGVEIGSYLGEQNGRVLQADHKNGADILIIDSDHVHFDALRVRNYRRYGLWLYGNVGQFSADTAEFDGARERDPIPWVPTTARTGFGTARVDGVAR